MQRRIAQWACIVATMLLMSACGESESGVSTPRVNNPALNEPTTAVTPAPKLANDAERAGYGLIRREEIPTEVKRERNMQNDATCSPRVLFKDGATAMLTTRRFVIPNGTVQQTVALFSDARTAKRAFDNLDSRANRRCIQQDTYDEISERTGERVPQLTNQILNIEALGQQSTAYRLSTTAVARSVGSDILLNRVHRGISSVSITWQVVPNGLELQEQLVATIATRLQQALS